MLEPRREKSSRQSRHLDRTWRDIWDIRPDRVWKILSSAYPRRIITPSSGTAVVNDFDVLTQQERVRRSVGVMFQEVFIDDWLTAREVLDLHAQLQGLPRGTREKRIESLLSQLGLAEKSGVAVRYFTPLKKGSLPLLEQSYTPQKY